VDPLRLRDFAAGDEAGILELKCSVFPSLARANEERRWRWEFDGNPARSPPFPRAIVFERGTRIVGAFVFLPYRVQVAEDVVFGASGIDLCIDPSARGGGHVHEMVRRWLEPGFAAFPFAVALNDASRHLFTKHGAQLLGGSGESIAWGHFLAHPHRTSERPALATELVSGIPADADELWERIRGGQRLQLVRDADYLRWRWRDFPFGGVTMIRALGERGETRGLAMVQDDPKAQDLYVAELMHAAGDDAAQRGLLRRAVESARGRRGSGTERGATRNVLWFSTRDPRQLPVVQEEGFVLVPAPVPTFCARLHHVPKSGAVRVDEWATAIGDGDQLFNCNEPRPAAGDAPRAPEPSDGR
jgi:RimJ/RimL family protein N-acetyltransferase